MLSEYPHFTHLSLPDQLRLAAGAAEDRLPLPMVDAIQRAADLLEQIGCGGGASTAMWIGHLPASSRTWGGMSMIASSPYAGLTVP